MKNRILFLLITILLSSCDREAIVDKSKLRGTDYRIFQQTEAWEIAKAVQDQDEEKIKKLIEQNPSLLSFQDSILGNSLLKLATVNNDWNSFNVLIDLGSSINVCNNKPGVSLLSSACYLSDYRFIEKLIEKGADVNQLPKNPNHRFYTDTPLEVACRRDRFDVVKLLLEHGAKIDEPSGAALSSSIVQENFDIALYLLEHGADYNAVMLYYHGDKNQPAYIIDILRSDIYEYESDLYYGKMKIVDFLKTKGIDYFATPVPEHIKEKLKKEYPGSWEEYIEFY